MKLWQAAAGQGEDLYALVVMQAPPVLTFSHKNRAVLCAGVGRVEEALEVDRARWLRKRRGPVCLSDGQAWHALPPLRSRRVRVLVWCAMGDGWDCDPQTSKCLNVPSLAAALEAQQGRAGGGTESGEAQQLRAAIVCMQYGAKRVAAKLAAAGIPVVLWVRASLDAVQDAFVGLMEKLIYGGAADEAPPAAEAETGAA